MAVLSNQSSRNLDRVAVGSEEPAEVESSTPLTIN